MFNEVICGDLFCLQQKLTSSLYQYLPIVCFRERVQMRCVLTRGKGLMLMNGLF